MLVRSAESRALPALPYLRYPRGGAPAPIPQSSSPSARARARAETARRRRFPFPRADAGVARRGRGAHACADLRPGCPRSGAGRSGEGRSRVGRGFEVIPEPPPRLRLCGETESGRWLRLWPWRRRPQELGPETRRRAVGPRKEVSVDPAAGGATGAGRRPTRFRAGAAHLCLQRDSDGPETPPCSFRGCRGPDPRKPGRAPG